MEFDELSRSVIGSAIEVHRTLGPGLLESTYRQCIAYELLHAQIRFKWSCRYRSATEMFYWIAAIESICLSAATSRGSQSR